ncbi:hypothetical protein K432DRAFT_385737 [Lepidopterella palustris CBS 459.81]|uniref:F-box domain-containing protein n=1 Tax=Lepidopterella palustris CBS 459.81 TaxID=1314670 RepID=A0A8E2E2J8_9PEZI|nr:hypothetical protein K432DRAFT_385737 [Lepidopterella palustris CBS 459.81]
MSIAPYCRSNQTCSCQPNTFPENQLSGPKESKTILAARSHKNGASFIRRTTTKASRVTLLIRKSPRLKQLDNAPLKVPGIAALPVELLQQITSYLPNVALIALGLTCRSILAAIGTEHLGMLKELWRRPQKWELLMLLARDLPDYFPCEPCYMLHSRELRASTPRASSTIAKPGPIMSLPPELLQMIAGYLPTSSQASLALTSRAVCRTIGTVSWSEMKKKHWEKLPFLIALRRDLPEYGTCAACCKLLHRCSKRAWPMLKRSWGESANAALYWPSNYYLQLVLDYNHHGTRNGFCQSRLECTNKVVRVMVPEEGLSRSPFLNKRRAIEIVIEYSTSVRVVENGIVWNAEYSVTLPADWNSLAAMRYWDAPNRLYLCPHVGARLQEPLGRSKPPSHGDHHQGFWRGWSHHKEFSRRGWQCTECPTEFSEYWPPVVDEGGETKVVYNVWHYSRAINSCSDGLRTRGFVHLEEKDGIACVKPGTIEGNEFYFGKIEEMFSNTQKVPFVVL